MRHQAKEDHEQAKRTGQGPLTLEFAAGRYFKEVGEHHVAALTTWTDLARLLSYFGKDKRLDEITDADVAALVSWRRKQTVKDRKKDKAGNPAAVIAPATVNRSTTILLKALFTRAKRTWRYQFSREPIWRDHWLKEPQERVRELHEHEAEALDASVRDDYAPWFAFARLTGLRRNETLIKWSNVNWFAKRITIIGKGDKQVTTPITPSIRAILEPLKGQHPEYVFTYVCERTRDDRVKGKRYPITPEGAKTQWRRLRSRAKVEDFRFHDIRHDVATKLLRDTGNLKLVQRALNHSDVKTTAKYAHVMDDEVATALERISNPAKSPAIKTKDVG
jgi:integrase